MKKGWSVISSSTDSPFSHQIFISSTWLKIIALCSGVLLLVFIMAIVNYATVYYQALQTVVLKRRNAEIEHEFAKLQEIKENLESVEENNKKLKIMLGIDKSPGPVEPDIRETPEAYADTMNLIVEEKQNIPSLLPTHGHISRTFSVDHQGIDIAAPRFSAVVAAASGIVQDVGWDEIFGNYVILEHNINYSTFYGHLNSIDARIGERVAGGSVIGTVGSTGKSTSPHLHYEVRFRDTPVDPNGYLQIVISL